MTIGFTERWDSLRIQQDNFERESKRNKESMARDEYLEWLRLPYVDYSDCKCERDMWNSLNEDYED